MNLNEFEQAYSYEFLSNADYDIHCKMLARYFNDNPSTSDLVIFDVGCNAGSFIRAVRSYVEDAKIHCFEPHPVLAKYLTDTYRDIVQNSVCLANYEGKCIINLPTKSVALGSIIKREVFQMLQQHGQSIVEYECESQTIDGYCSKLGISKINYLKVDVEGYELQVMLGAKNLLSKRLIEAGHFETGMESEGGYTREDIVNYLESFGYKVVTTLSQNDLYFHL